jgi:hypothetical protein
MLKIYNFLIFANVFQLIERELIGPTVPNPETEDLAQMKDATGETEVVPATTDVQQNHPEEGSQVCECEFR